TGTRSTSSQAVVTAFKLTAQTLRSNYGMLADQGITLREVWPSTIIVIFGARATADIGLGGGGHGLITLVIIPQKVTWRKVGDSTIHTQWRTRVGAAGMVAGTVGYGVDTGGGLYVGVGGVWGTLPSPQDFHGALLGVQISGNAWGIGMSG